MVLTAHIVKLAHNTPVRALRETLTTGPAAEALGKHGHEHGKAEGTFYMSAGASFMHPNDLKAAESHIQKFISLIHGFNEGRRAKGKSTSAFIHGGTEAGLMKTAADAASGKTVPVIGVSPHQATESGMEGHGSTPVAKGTVHIVTDSAESHPSVEGGKPLDIKDKYGHWGTERKVMMDVIRSSSVEGAPVFSIVGNGGGGALKEVVDLLRMSKEGKHDHHIVLLKGSGRVADALAEYYEKGTSLKGIKVQVKDLAKVSKPEEAYKTMDEILAQEGITEKDLSDHKASIHVHDIREENAVEKFERLFHKTMGTEKR